MTIEYCPVCLVCTIPRNEAHQAGCTAVEVFERRKILETALKRIEVQVRGARTSLIYQIVRDALDQFGG